MVSCTWRIMSRSVGFILFGVILIGLLVGCGGQSGASRNQTGRASRYIPGIPSFDLETVPSAPGQQAHVKIYLSVPSVSMTFEKDRRGFRSMQEIRVALREPVNETVLLERTWTDTTSVASYVATQRHDPFLISRSLDVPPGEYEVEVTLENLSSGKSEMRHQFVLVPDPEERSPYLGKVLIEARTANGTFLPVVPVHVPSGLDSLRCTTKLCNADPVRPSFVSLDLVRYITDSLAATPPMYLTAFDLPLGYAMVGFEKADTVFVLRPTVVAGSTKDTNLAIGIRGLPSGNYNAAFEVQTPAPGPVPHDTLLRVERFISLGGPTFPRPSTLPELIESMQYIASRDEMKLLREAATPEIARARFDSLWLSFRHDKSAAANLINRYYSRVEEANRRFTTTKEGWRTDQGMVFIVLGPPIEVMNSKDRQIWYYDHRGEDAVNVYTFQHRVVNDGRVPIDTYFLFRQAYYQNFWDRQVEKWRSGEVF
jgi:GWxTD domain-containing protein